MYTYIYICIYVSISLGWIAGSHGKSMFYILRNCCAFGYDLNICVLPNSYVEILPPGNNIRRWSLLKLITNGISSFIKEAWESSLISDPLLSEDTTRSWESAARKRSLSRTWPCCHPDLGLSASRTESNTFLLCKLPSLWYFVKAAWVD